MLKEFPVPLGSRPHDVAPSLSDNVVVWYTTQTPAGTRQTKHLNRQNSSYIPRPKVCIHGVIVGTDGASWITDGGLNAIVRVDSITEDIKHSIAGW